MAQQDWFGFLSCNLLRSFLSARPWGEKEKKKNPEQVADQQVQRHKTVAAMWFVIAVINFHLSSRPLWRRGDWAELICCSSIRPRSPKSLKIWDESVNVGGVDVV